jgi:acetylornithine deacetylase/succinyl-diaminopimelate desuccinylase-like protein
MADPMSDAALAAYLEAHANDAQLLLEVLCRQPSVVAQNLGIAEMADLIETLLGEIGFQTQRLHTEGAPPTIYGELRGRSDYTILLYNHYDVQPPEPFELWHTPPFEPTVRDGKLYARGVSDNKAEIASRLTAIRALKLSMVNCQLPFAGLSKARRRSVARISEQLHRSIVHCCKPMDAFGRVLDLIQHFVRNWD